MARVSNIRYDTLFAASDSFGYRRHDFIRYLTHFMNKSDNLRPSSCIIFTGFRPPDSPSNHHRLKNDMLGRVKEMTGRRYLSKTMIRDESDEMMIQAG